MEGLYTPDIRHGLCGRRNPCKSRKLKSSSHNIHPTSYLISYFTDEPKTLTCWRDKNLWVYQGICARSFLLLYANGAHAITGL